MEATCRRALELGLPSVAFTEHVDWVRGTEAVLDVPAYFECIEECRAKFPGLRILSGVELGEAHRYPDLARALLQAPFDRVLGSVHCIEWGGDFIDASQPGFLTPGECREMFRRFLAETLALLESDQPFDVLTHLDYPKRYWPREAAFSEADFEDGYRRVLRAAAKRGAVLEINTTRGGPPERYMCPGPIVVRWWREEGGRAVSFGSDAHSPDDLAAGFVLAQAAAEAAGFRPAADPLAFWTA